MELGIFSRIKSLQPPLVGLLIIWTWMQEIPKPLPSTVCPPMELSSHYPPEPGSLQWVLPWSQPNSQVGPGTLLSVQCCSGSILAKGKAAAIFMGSAARSPTAGEGYSPISLPPVTSLFETPGSLVSGLRTFDQCHMRLR